jgi:hypothetical protein
MSADVGEAVRSKVSSGSFPQVPWPLVVVAALVAVAGLAMTFVGASQSGVSVDEAGHVNRLEAFIDDGLYVRGYERRGFAEDVIPPNAFVYAPGTARIMHAINQLAGNELPGQPSGSAEAFTVRHYVVAAMSVVALLSVFGVCWLMLGSWRWGLVGVAALSAIPMWTGHAMFNPKDTPVGVGYTLMTFSMAGLVVAARLAGRTRLLSVAVMSVGMIFGVALMLGTRPGMWPGLAVAVVVTVGFLVVGRALDRWVILGLLAGLAGSYAALWKIYPRIFDNPIAMMKVSLGQSTAFPKGVAPGRGYVFERTAIEWPILLLVFMLVGTVIGAWLCVRLLKADPQRATVIALVGAQAQALTMAAVMSKSNIYDGLRQLLFAVPAQAALATLGIAVAVAIAGRRWMRWAIVGSAITALVLPTVVQARLFPYQYAYGNVAAELLDAEILDDTWKVSFREHIEEIPPTAKAICPNNPPLTGPIERYGSDCRGSYGVIKPHWLAYWHHDRFDPDSPFFYTVLRSNRPVPANCRVIQDVTRMRNVKRVIMSRLLRCTTDYPRPSGSSGAPA